MFKCNEVIFNNKITQNVEDKYEDYENNYNFIMNFSILKILYNKYICCPECGNKIILQDNIGKKMGFCLQLEIFCKNCDEIIGAFKISVVSNRSAEINTKIVVTFREIGKGYTPLESFNRCMNMPRQKKVMINRRTEESC